MSKQLNELLDKEGNLISPILPSEIKNYLIDIDGTITDDVPNEEPERMATCRASYLFLYFKNRRTSYCY